MPTYAVSSSCAVLRTTTRRACVRAASGVGRSRGDNRSDDGDGYGSADAKPANQLAARDAICARGPGQLLFEQVIFFELTQGEPDNILVNDGLERLLQTSRYLRDTRVAVTMFPDESCGRVQAMRLVALGIVD